jgi:hypothetical protein
MPAFRSLWCLSSAFALLVFLPSLGCSFDMQGQGAFDAGMTGSDASTGGSGGVHAGGFSGQAGDSQHGGGSCGESGNGGVPSTGGTGVGAGGSGPAGSAGSPSTEVCTDGVDNDFNGDTDCADAQCHALGYSCLPPIPSGWVGFFRVNVQANAETAPFPAVCPDGSMPERYMRDKAGDALCDTCSCGLLQGAACAGPEIECDWSSSNCSNAVPIPELQDYKCHNTPPNKNVSCRLTGNVPVANYGYCTPSPSTPDFTNKLPFHTIVDACHFDAKNGGGCTNQDICLKVGQGDYTGAVCIMTADENAHCPARWDSNGSMVMYMPNQAEDRRGCEPCKCEPDQEVTRCEGGAYKAYDFNGCSDCVLFCNSEISVNSTSCVNLSKLTDSDSFSMKVDPKPEFVGGLCAVSGGLAIGSVETTGGVTFCCLSP